MQAGCRGALSHDAIRRRIGGDEVLREHARAPPPTALRTTGHLAAGGPTGRASRRDRRRDCHGERPDRDLLGRRRLAGAVAVAAAGTALNSLTPRPRPPSL